MFPIPQKPSNFSFGMGVFELRFQPWYLMSEQVIWPVHSRDVVRPDPLRGTVSVPEAQGSWSQENIPKEVVGKSCFFRNHSPNPLCTPTITTMTRIGPKIARPGCETPSVFSPQPPARASADWEHLFLVVVRHLPHQIKQALRCSRIFCWCLNHLSLKILVLNCPEDPCMVYLLTFTIQINQM